MTNKYTTELKDELAKYKEGVENEVIASCERLIDANEKLVTRTLELNEDYAKIEVAATTALKLMEVIKDLHIFMGSVRDKLENEKGYKEIMDILAHLILAAGVRVENEELS